MTLNEVLSPEEKARAVIGHNRAVAYEADLRKLEAQLAELTPCTTEGAPKLRDVMKLAGEAFSGMEVDRKEAQDPHQEKIDDIRAAYRPLTERASRVKEGARQALNIWSEADRLRLEHEAAEANRIAQEASAEAARRAQEANPFEVEETLDAAKNAAEAALEAEYVGKVAASGPRVGSASGIAKAGGQRTTWSAKVTDTKKAAAYFHKHPDVVAVLTKLASAQMRASKGVGAIPGCEPVETRNFV